MAFQKRRIIWILMAIAIEQTCGIYDPRTNSGPNRNMMPQIHGDYSKVHTHKSRAYEPNYARSDHNLHYHSSAASNQQPVYVPAVTTTTRTEPLIQKQRAEKLQSSYTGYGNENAILDASNPKLKNSQNFENADSFTGLQCPPLQSGQFVYIMDCRQYLNCWKGRGYIQSCAPGTLFNPETSQCDQPSKVNCITSNTMDGYQSLARLRKPKNSQLASYVQEDYDDSRYGQPTAALEVRCPPHVIGLRAHPTDCRKFLNCNDGATVIQDCGPGTAFNPAISVCDHIYKVDCNRNENLIHHGSTKQTNPDAEEIDVESVSYDIDVRFRGDDEPAFSTVPSIPLQASRPIYQRPASSDIRPVYVAPPTTTPATTTPKMNQANTRFNPTYYQKVTPNPRESTVGSTELPLSEALKMLLKPFMGNKDVDINMTSLNTKMSSTTPPADLNVLGINQSPKPSNKTSAYIASPYEINSQLGGYQSVVYGMPTYRPPVPFHPSFNSQNFNRQHASSPITPQQHQQKQQPQQFYPVFRPRATTTSPPVRSRFGEESSQWRPMATVTTTKRPTTTADPCEGKFLCDNGRCIDQAKVCNGKNDCANRADERNCSHLGYEVRLSNKHHGRVEVKILDKWGYVCDDNFSLEAANVLCRELGYETGALELKPHSFYPPNAAMMRDGSPVFIMDEVRCSGNETSLRECDFAGWGVHDCNAEEVLGVVCKTPKMTCPLDYWLCDTSAECVPVGFLCDNVNDCADGSDESVAHCNAPLEMRLVEGPTKQEGRVEVKYRGIWGTICDDDFGIQEARVVCRQLGFNGTAEVRKNKYKQGTGQIWLDQVACSGNETSIDDCIHWHWGEHNCGHGEDVGVKCGLTVQAPRPTSAQLRAAGKSFKLDFVEKSSKIYPDSCGQLQINPNLVKPTYGSRVVHGGETVYGHHPWQAALRAKKQGKSVHWCGAVLISKYHILTAAHCLIGYPKGAYMIRIGDYNTDALEQAEIDIFIEDYYIHEEFRVGHHMNNDIAVVLLKTPIRFSEYVQPVCLPAKSQPYQEGMNCTISGWGSTQSGSSVHSLELRAAKVPLLSDATCNKPEVYGNNITEGMFCAGTLDGGVDACEGDSGGPLVCASSRGHTLYGIISWGLHCGYANKPGVYVKVAHYLDWIEQKLKQSQHTYGV
ncbi:uncharacterized protein LOC134288486 isoform X1 [Aedes albopictus]|uniref:Trypsin-like serine protease n=1 Tax=Aedes albopictus TaxID=7160 RepID=A0ABM1YFL1_AEDAL